MPTANAPPTIAAPTAASCVATLSDSVQDVSALSTGSAPAEADFGEPAEADGSAGTPNSALPSAAPSVMNATSSIATNHRIRNVLFCSGRGQPFYRTWLR